jgi:hypothetical protein
MRVQVLHVVQLAFFTQGANEDFQLVVEYLQLVPMQEKTGTHEIF